MTGPMRMDAHQPLPFEDLIGGLDSDPVLSVTWRLRAAISLGFIRDGETLPSEPLLAEHLGTTVFTLRAALAALRDEGLISTRRGRGGGSVITAADVLGPKAVSRRMEDLSTAEVRDIGEWHQVLAGAEAMFAAERASARNVARLREYVHRLETAADPAETLSAYGRVHLELAAAAQSVRMMREEIHFISTHGWIFAAALGSEDGRRAFARTYTRVIQAVQQSDAKRARRLAETHAQSLTAFALAAHLDRLRSERGEPHDDHPA